MVFDSESIPAVRDELLVEGDNVVLMLHQYYSFPILRFCRAVQILCRVDTHRGADGVFGGARIWLTIKKRVPSY